MTTARRTAPWTALRTSTRPRAAATASGARNRNTTASCVGTDPAASRAALIRSLAGCGSCGVIPGREPALLADVAGHRRHRAAEVVGLLVVAEPHRMRW